MTFEIAQYVINFFGGGTRSIRPYKYRAIVALYDSSGRVGEIRFHAHEHTMPGSDTLSDDGQLILHYPADCISQIVDLIRNERPIYLHQYAHLPTMIHLSTDKEPVGEGELGL